MLCVVALWFATTQVAHLISPGRFPSPSDVYKAAVQIGTPPGYAGATLAHHVIISLELVFFGFLVAIATGVPKHHLNHTVLSVSQPRST